MSRQSSCCSSHLLAPVTERARLRWAHDGGSPPGDAAASAARSACSSSCSGQHTATSARQPAGAAWLCGPLLRWPCRSQRSHMRPRPQTTGGSAPGAVAGTCTAGSGRPMFDLRAGDLQPRSCNVGSNLEVAEAAGYFPRPPALRFNRQNIRGVLLPPLATGVRPRHADLRGTDTRMQKGQGNLGSCRT